MGEKLRGKEMFPLRHINSPEKDKGTGMYIPNELLLKYKFLRGTVILV